jgi:hypothetical protein
VHAMPRRKSLDVEITSACLMEKGGRRPKVLKNVADNIAGRTNALGRHARGRPGSPGSSRKFDAAASKAAAARRQAKAVTDVTTVSAVVLGDAGMSAMRTSPATQALRARCGIAATSHAR